MQNESKALEDLRTMDRTERSSWDRSGITLPPRDADVRYEYHKATPFTTGMAVSRRLDDPLRADGHRRGSGILVTAIDGQKS